MSLPNFNEVNIPSDSEEEDDYQGSNLRIELIFSSCV